MVKTKFNIGDEIVIIPMERSDPKHSRGVIEKIVINEHVYYKVICRCGAPFESLEEGDLRLLGSKREHKWRQSP